MTKRRVVVVMGVVLGAATSAWAGTVTATFAPLGIPAGTTFLQAQGVSADGTVVVGYAGNPSGGDFAFRRTITDFATGAGVTTLISPTSPATTALARNVSGDGSVVVGRNNNSSSFFQGWSWTQASGQVPVPTLPAWTQTFANNANHDGTVIVGDASTPSSQRGFRLQNGVPTQLNPLPGFGAAAALAVSNDGAVVSGYSFFGSGGVRFQMTRWAANGTATPLPMAPGHDFSFTINATPDGSVVVGTGGLWGVSSLAVLWSQATGTVALPIQAGWNNGQAFDVSDDGNVIVGSVQSSSNLLAVVWDRSTGTANDLNALLPSLGVNLNGFRLEQATGVSANGRVITGFGRTSTFARDSWVVTLTPVPPQCAGDTNGDGLVNNADLSVLLGQFSQSVTPGSGADFNGDGLVNNADLSVLLGRFSQAC